MASRLSSTRLVFKGLKQGLTLIIPEEGSFSYWLEVLIAQLKETKEFFHGASIIVELGNRKISSSDQSQLRRVLEEVHGISIKSINPETPKGQKNSISSLSLKKKKAWTAETILISGTVRNGQRIEFAGNIVVKGDVNPGAEIIATGDIMVFGKMRGIAHAGAGGNDDSEVLALNLQPVQIRIGAHLSRAPEEVKERNGPEVARIKGNEIVVERYGREF